jgi:hypothetical protein
MGKTHYTVILYFTNVGLTWREPWFDPNEWYLKNGLLSGGLNPRPLSHESSALTPRPRLLAYHRFNIWGKLILP